MKKYIFSLLLFVLLAFATACSDDDLGPSIFDTSGDELTELDLWLQEKFVDPYNIEVIYKWKDVETSMGYNLTPPKEENAKGLANVLLNIWCEPYMEVGGSRSSNRSPYGGFVIMNPYFFGCLRSFTARS